MLVASARVASLPSSAACVSATPSATTRLRASMQVSGCSDFVEIAVVGVGDLGRNVALRDAVHVLGGPRSTA